MKHSQWNEIQTTVHVRKFDSFLMDDVIMNFKMYLSWSIMFYRVKKILSMPLIALTVTLYSLFALCLIVSGFVLSYSVSVLLPCLNDLSAPDKHFHLRGSTLWR